MFNFLLSHLDVIFGALLGTKVLATAIVNSTATPKDDEIVGKVYRVIEWAAGIWSVRAKALPGESLPGLLSQGSLFAKVK